MVSPSSTVWQSWAVENTTRDGSRSSKVLKSQGLATGLKSQLNKMSLKQLYEEWSGKVRINIFFYLYKHNSHFGLLSISSFLLILKVSTIYQVIIFLFRFLGFLYI